MATGSQKWAIIRKSLIEGNTYNDEVNSHFGDTSQDPGRDAAKNLCLVQSDDSAAIAQQRISFFYHQVLRVQDKPVIIGQPKVDLDADVKYHPQICVYLVQDSSSVPRGKYPKDARFCWRLITETSESITTQTLNTWATSVYNSFFNPVFTFNKGKYIGWYESPIDGLHLQLYSYDSPTAQSVAQTIVAAAGKQWNQDYFRLTNPSRSNLPPSGGTTQISILGKTMDAPQWRPNVTVSARYAYINIWGESDVQMIVDKFGSGFMPILR